VSPRWASTGVRAHTADLWIAASARHINASLLSADRIFDHAPGIRLADVWSTNSAAPPSRLQRSEDTHDPHRLTRKRDSRSCAKVAIAGRDRRFQNVPERVEPHDIDGGYQTFGLPTPPDIE
jgi:hypothetical protein